MTKARAYTDNDLRGITSSFDLASEIILCGKVPKEKEQVDLLLRSFHNNTSAMKAYRSVVNLLLSKPDSYFDPLLPFLHDAVAELPFSGLVKTDLFGPRRPKPGVEEGIKSEVRAGKARKLYEQRPEVEQWISDTVSEVFGLLEQGGLLEVSSGRELFRTFSVLRFAYGQLLATLTPYLAPADKHDDELVCSFASVAVSDVRKALLNETLDRLNSNPAFKRVASEFGELVKASAAGHLRVFSLCSRSQFDATRQSLLSFSQDPGQLAEAVGSFLVRTHFVDLALPHLQEHLRRAAPAALKSDFFVPGQLASVDISPDHSEPTVYVSFESHSDTTVVAVQVEGIAGMSHNLAGIGLPEAFDFAANGAVGLSINRQGKMFSSYAQRLLKQEETPETATMRSTLEGCIAVQQHKLAGLWARHPELLSIISDDEPTVVVFDGPRAFVLGTCLPGNQARISFFSGSSETAVGELLHRANIEVQDPSVWLMRRLEDGTQAEALPELSETELSRRDVRRDLRTALHRTGQMKYRDFVSSLKPWSVVETTDGHGGHGSLKRKVEGRELRAGTWGALRDPDPNVTFGRIYEILESLAIPVEEYTRGIMEKRL